MTAVIHQLHPSTEIGHYLRIGYSGYRQIEVLQASGNFAFARVVVDAAHCHLQSDLLDSLRQAGCETILDTRVAELSSTSGWISSARDLPWARDGDGPLLPEAAKQRELAIKIAEFAIEQNFDAVLAPTRMILDGVKDPWFSLNFDLARCLRQELDLRGGRHIGIDYAVLLTYQQFLDRSIRNELINRICDVEHDNIWLRIGNFGSDKSAAGMKKFLYAARDLHSSDSPVIADCFGGLPALGMAAFGAISGFCHGVGINERFYPKWHLEKPKKSGFSGQKRVFFANIDGYLNESQANELFKIRSAKTLLGCRNTGCCPGGWEDMISNWKRHYFNQVTDRVSILEGIPDLRRPEYFLSKQIAEADRTARRACKLNLPEELGVKFRKQSRKLDDLRSVYDELLDTSHNISRAISPIKRSSATAAAESKGGLS